MPYRQVGDERAGAKLIVALVGGVTHHHVGRASQQAAGDPLGECELTLGRSVRQASRALEGGRQERGGARRDGPVFVVEACDPQVIEPHPEGVEQSQDLDRRRLGLRLEDLRRSHAAQAGERVSVSDARQDRAQLGKMRKQFTPRLDGLIVGARQGGLARPAQAREQGRKRAGPLGRARLRG